MSSLAGWPYLDYHPPRRTSSPRRPMWKSKFYGTFELNRRVVLDAIDATPARWRGDAGSSPLDGARTAAPSPRNDLVKNCRVHPTHWSISTQPATPCVSDSAQRFAGPNSTDASRTPPRPSSPSEARRAGISTPACKSNGESDAPTSRQHRGHDDCDAPPQFDLCTARRPRRRSSGSRSSRPRRRPRGRRGRRSPCGPVPFLRRRPGRPRAPRPGRPCRPR